jgi:hypothetical protein
MRRNVRTESEPFTFRGASIVPILAILAIIWILWHATAREFLVNGAVFAVGTILYLVQWAVRRQTGRRG